MVSELLYQLSDVDVESNWFGPMNLPEREISVARRHKFLISNVLRLVIHNSIKMIDRINQT